MSKVPTFATDPNFGTITDADLDSVTAVTATSAETFFSAGTVLNVNGDFTMTGDGAGLNMLIGSPDIHDQINITGDLAADGVLTLDIGNGGLNVQAGDVFDLFTFSSASGAFDDIELPTLAGGLGWDTSSLLVTGELAVLSVGLPGDYNNDGTVDAADYTVWRDNLGAADETALNGNGDGMNGVDEADYALWKANYGTTLGTGSAALAQAVPEPATIVLLPLAVAAASLWRRAPSVESKLHQAVSCRRRCLAPVQATTVWSPVVSEFRDRATRLGQRVGPNSPWSSPLGLSQSL